MKADELKVEEKKADELKVEEKKADALMKVVFHRH